jgi:hypothetical protein
VNAASRRGPLALAAGLLMVFSSIFLPFPIGCNASAECLADPVSWWSTVWPNILVFGLGLLVLAMGYAWTRMRKPTLSTLGAMSIVDGIVLANPGLLVTWWAMKYPDYFTTGSPPTLGSGPWWSLFWPGVLGGVMGIVLMALGAVAVARAKRRVLGVLPYVLLVALGVLIWAYSIPS